MTVLGQFVAVGAVVVATVGVAGCGGPADARSGEPFEVFRRADLVRIEKVNLAVFHDCLARSGYRQPAAEPGDLFARLTEKPLQPRTEAEALRHGFGKPMPAQPAQLLRKDRAFFAAADTCETAALAKLGDPAEVARVRDSYVELGNRLGRELGQRVKTVLQEESGVLVPCLADNGHPLPAGVSFDARKNVSQFGIRIGTHAAPVRQPVRKLPGGSALRPGVPARAYLPTAEESRFAVAFVRCGESTGLFARVDARLPALQQAIVDEHAGEFSELNPRIEAIAKKAVA